MLAACNDGSAPPRASLTPVETSSSPAATGTDSAGYTLRGPKAKPSFIGPGAAGVCADGDEIVKITFETDVPSPRCTFVLGSQRLRVTNHFDKTVTATLGPLTIVLPRGATVTVKETFDTYLEPGGHFMKTNVYEGSVEIRFEPDRAGTG